MKVLTCALLLFTCLMMPKVLFGAEDVREEQQVFLINETNEKIEIRLSTHDKREVVTLSAGDKLKIDLLSVTALYILPYGKLKGLMSKDVLSLGHVPATNYLEDPVFEVTRKRQVNSCINIMPGVEEGSNVFTRLISSFQACVMPYSLVQVDEVVEDKGLKGIVFDWFPQAQEAYNEGREILPRYFLRVPENASREEILAAYERSLERWKAMLESSKERKKNLASRIVSIINEAGKKLLGKKNQYDFQLFRLGVSNNAFIQSFIEGPVYLSASESDSSSIEDVIT